MLKITFLGTGTSQGVPMIACHCDVCRSTDPHDKRLRCSAMVESGSTRIIIDAGPDFRYQMLRAGIEDIDAILLTHGHKDHTGGIDDVRAFNYFDRKAIDIYATRAVQHTVRKDFDYAFTQNRYPGVPEINLRSIFTGRPFRVGDMDIQPIEGLHYRMPVTGFRIGPLAYLTDFNHIEQSEIDRLRGVDTLVINALRHEKHISHYSLPEAMEVCRQVGARENYFTHMSHQIGLHQIVSQTLPDGYHFAYDGLVIEVGE